MLFALSGRHQKTEISKQVSRRKLRQTVPEEIRSNVTYGSMQTGISTNAAAKTDGVCFGYTCIQKREKPPSDDSFGGWFTIFRHCGSGVQKALGKLGGRLQIPFEGNSAVIYMRNCISQILNFPLQNGLQPEMTWCNKFH